MTSYSTSLPKVILAITAGGIIGGGLHFLFSSLYHYLTWGRVPEHTYYILLASLAGAFLGLLAIGGPLWALLHLANLRRPICAFVAGAISPIVALIGIGVFSPGDFRYIPAGFFSVDLPMMMIVSAIVGVAIWKLAYSPSTDVARGTLP
ncbi:MAG: hypothetical protein JJ873_16050 [Maricaulis sp.]|jgi:hypothetical protein|uniref:hypothetical protein n=1 Tax=Maricaulis sp. TaxID=1486257 RepID=UPI001B073A4A|nr:hypothetical protein [Maricaulis sp.]MBO6696919.1 hypothetical protein [Henriciella sp.]MBO6731039.1 hypothetical protein [Maricaulis sp.]MBO6878898.1 hypothetical protein [Maricaulis sp.]